MFYNLQEEANKTKYKSYLKISASLSKLFSESTIPYIHYRTTENIFCFSFDATNLARDDIAIDAKKDKVGIGIKTFLHNNGNTLQKIAEFNKLRAEFENKTADEIIIKASVLRNKRIDIALKLHGLEESIYHCITREEGKLYLHEEKMDFIDIDSIQNIQKNKNTILFDDGKHEYSFSLSKHTLFKRFTVYDTIDSINIKIIENPFNFLYKCFDEDINIKYLPKEKDDSQVIKKEKQYIYLPMYAPSDSKKRPAEKSGLNQWNAGGRARHPNEVYIPVPSWIHHKFPDFFPESNDIYFKLHLPNGKTLQASMCQQGRKGLMSNPNKELGKWLLRDVLKLPEETLVTRKILDEAGIDSVLIEKINDREYSIRFASTGKYEEFKSFSLGE